MASSLENVDLVIPARWLPGESRTSDPSAPDLAAPCGALGGGRCFGDTRCRAAQYVRMSTEHQQYSTINQMAAISAYAAERGLEVVRTYSDEAKSGLALKWRAGLRQLLADVLSGAADYCLVLVYDVSRWGRFQDPDESAHYEYICRKQGVHVEYCGEPFRNDLSASSSLIKNIKRMMAGEFSRELSAKSFAGKCRLVRKGLSTGVEPVYGLRRMLVDALGRPRAILERGESKYCQTDRVILVPGPTHERAIVRWIFRQAADHGKGLTAIAAELNARGEPWRPGRPWNDGALGTMLRNEKYVGNMVYNRRSAKLRGRWVSNPPEEWIRADGAITPTVGRAVFDRAQEALRLLNHRMPEPIAVAKLKALYEREGRLSGGMIDAEAGMPTSDWYRVHFKSLYGAYAAVGFKPARNSAFTRGYRTRWRLLAEYRQRVASGMAAVGVAVARERRIVLRLAGRLRLGVLMSRFREIDGRPRWVAQIHFDPQPDWLLVARLDAEETAVIDHTLVPGGRQIVMLTAGGVGLRRTEERFGDLGVALARLACLSECQQPQAGRPTVTIGHPSNL